MQRFLRHKFTSFYLTTATENRERQTLETRKRDSRHERGPDVLPLRLQMYKKIPLQSRSQDAPVATRPLERLALFQMFSFLVFQLCSFFILCCFPQIKRNEFGFSHFSRQTEETALEEELMEALNVWKNMKTFQCAEFQGEWASIPLYFSALRQLALVK